MMRWIVGASLRLRLLVVAAAAVIMAYGIEKLDEMPVDIFPEFAPPYVQIQTEALGLSAAEIEQMVTVPLEADLLNGVPWLDTIHSESVPGLSSIFLTFEPGTNLMRARQMVQERLTQAHALPNVSKPPVMIQPLSSASRVMMIGLSSKELSPIEMSVLAYWTMRPRLMGVSGVANVSIWGQRDRQLQVQVDPQRLRDQGVSLLQVVKTTGNALWVSPLSFLNASTPGTGGFIETPNQRLGIRHVLPITSANDLAQVTVEGAALRLGDVATVVEDHQPLIGDALTPDGPGLILVVEKFPWASTLEVIEEVDEALDTLRPGLSGIKIDSSLYRPATFLKIAYDNIATMLLIGCALMVVVLGAFLYQWRTALIGIVAIPLSLLAAGLVLYLSGTTMNLMVLAGLVAALGAVVDDAIISIEHILRRLREHRKEGSHKATSSIVFEAAVESRTPIVYATLIILLAVLPVVFTQGLSGALYQPFALSYALALLVSMAVALTVTPALSLLLLSKAPLERPESPLVRWLYGRYDAISSRIVHRPRPVFYAVGIIVLAGLLVSPWLEQSMLPPLKQTDLLIHWEAPPGTSRTAMNRITSQVSGELRSLPGVRQVGAHVGRAVMSDQVVDVASSELWVSIDPQADYDATLASIQDVVDGYPGMYRNVLTYLDERIKAMQLGAGRPIVVRIYGQDLQTLRGKAEEVNKLLSQVDGIADPRVEHLAEEPVVEVKVDLDAAKRYGIKPGDVRRAAATLLSGITVGSLFEEQKVFEVVVWGAPETRHSLTSIRNLLIDTPGGGNVRLAEVAKVGIVPYPNVIKHDAVSRYIDVGADVRGRDLAAVEADVKRRLQDVEFPLEYRAEVLGRYAERQSGEARVSGFAIAAAIGIFLLLQASFGSWRLAFLAFLSLPAALAGGVLAVFATGGMVSIGSLAGFLAVLGIAARNSIMLIRRYQDLAHHEGETFGLNLVLRGTRERFVPILMTAATTALALLPLVLSGNSAGNEILHPMAIVIVGGLVTSTMLNVFIVPALYLRFGPGPELEIAEIQGREQNAIQ